MLKRILCLLCILVLLPVMPVMAQENLQWDFESDLGGWAVNKSGAGASISCEDGSLVYTVEKAGTTNTFLLSPDNLSINGAQNKKIKLRIKNTLAGVSSIKVAFITDADSAWDTTWTGSLVKTVSGPSLSLKDDYVDCVVDMSSNKLWNSSTIKRLRILISEFAGTTAGTMYVDSITIGEEKAEEVAEDVQSGAETTFSNVDESAYRKAASILYGAGLIDGTLFDTDHILTRGEFAYVISRSLFSGVPSAQTANTAFYDVPGIYKYADSIRIVSGAGVMSGSGDGNFMPHNELSFDECVAALVKLSGYSTWADGQGGYPEGYYAVAAKNEIFEGVVRSDKVNYAQVITMLKNTLDSEAIKYAQDGAYFKQNVLDETILSALADVYEDKGVVVANHVTSLTEASGTGNGEILVDIGDEVIAIKDITGAGQAMLGYEVDFAYKANGKDVAELIHITPTNRNNTLTVNYDEINPTTTKRKLVYELNGRKRTEDIDTSITTIYNNQYFASETDATYKPVYGDITLLDNSGDGKYDIIFVNNLVSKEVSSVDDRTIYYNSGNEKIDYTYHDNVKVIRNGKEGELSDLKRGDIVLICESPDGTNVVMTAVNETLTGTVNRIDLTELEIGIDDKTYKLNPYCAEAFKTGVKYKFRFDAKGNIAGIDSDYNSANSYVFLISMNIDEKTPLPVSAKFMTSTGKIVEYECDDKLRIDNILYNIDNEKSKIISHLKTAATTLNLSLGAFSQPAILKLDADGKIKEIDTIMVSENNTLVKDKGTDTNDKDSLVQSTSASTLQYYKNGTFQGKFAIDAKTTIFNIPEEHKDYDAYYVSGKGDLKEDDYTVIAFNATDYLYSDLVIMKEGGSSSYVENIALVKKVLTVYDDTHGEGHTVELMAGGKEMTLEIYNNSLPDDLDKGDIVRYSLKRDGNCLHMAKIFDYSAMKGTYVKNLSTSTSAAYTAKHRFSYGRVTSKNNTMFALTYGQKNDAEVFIGDSCTVAIYDPQSKTAEKGSIGDILSAEQNGEGSEVVVFTRHGIVKDVIIYKSMESEVSE